MSIEAEFIVNLGPYEHVKVTLSGENLSRTLMETAPDMPFGEALGDYHASLKAAVFYGRDKALLDVRLAAGIEQAKAGETKDLGDFSHHLRDDPEEAQPLFRQVEGEDLPNGNVAFKVHQGEPLTPLVDVPEEAQEDPVKLLTEELGATVLEVREKPAEAPSSPSTDRPWKSKPAAKKKKAWESEAPAAKPEPTKSDDWDW